MSDSQSDESNADDSEVQSALADSILPRASKEKYLRVYNFFMKWKADNKEKTLSERVFLTYFAQLSKRMKPSSLWGIYSMLKSTMQVNHNIYMKDYTNLLLWLKKNSVGFQSQKSKVFTEENIRKFIFEAPDEKYLVVKVALIIGVCGACQSVELIKFTTKHLKEADGVVFGMVHDPKNKTERLFKIREEFIPFVKKYQALRPENMETERFFINFRDGKCTKQVIGRHKMGNAPKEIAEYLQLPKPERYTGHCFRKSAAVFGSNVTYVDRGIKSKSKEDFSCSNEEEFGDLQAFARRYEKENPTQTIALEDHNTKAHVDGENTELESPFEICIKQEAMELINEDHSYHIKTEVETDDEVYMIEEENLNTIDDIHDETESQEVGFAEVHIDATSNKDSVSHIKTSQASGHGKKSNAIMEDSDDDMDLVHISSENEKRRTTLQSLRDETAQDTSNPHDTRITVAGKNITILFKNCANVGNVTVNIINK